MARFAARNGRLYMAITSAGTAEPIAYISELTLDQTAASIDVTALGDGSHVYVQGLPDAKGTYKGFLDNASAQLFTAAQDGVARKFYMYSDITASGGGTGAPYWFGTMFADASVSLAVSGAAELSGNLNAASTITRVN